MSYIIDNAMATMNEIKKRDDKTTKRRKQKEGSDFRGLVMQKSGEGRLYYR